jgi:uncharacterized membrane protein
MTELFMKATSPDYTPQMLRAELQQDESAAMKRRRAIVGASMVGGVAMGIVTLLQMGVVRHLPDPPTRKPNFDTDKVNSSDEAYGYGMPDGPLALAMHSLNLALAAAGPPNRAKRRPYLPIAAALASGAQAAVAGKYLFYTMPKVDKAWCPYCITDAVTHFATFALTIPEAMQALKNRAPKVTRH